MDSRGVPVALAAINPTTAPALDGGPGPPGLTFGIFPGMAGTEAMETAMSAATYDPGRTDEALARLQSPGRPFVIRGYVAYRGGGRVENRTPPDVERYLCDGRVLDYVLCYRSE